MKPRLELVGGPKDGELLTSAPDVLPFPNSGEYVRVDGTNFYRWVPE